MKPFCCLYIFHIRKFNETPDVAQQDLCMNLEHDEDIKLQDYM